MSFWDKLKRTFFVLEPVASSLPPPRPPEPAPDPRSPEEKWLDALIEAVAGGRELDQVAGAGFWARIDALQREHPKLAAEWLEKFAVAAPPGPARDEVRLRAATLRLDRGEDEEARPHLEALAEGGPHAARAHFALGEIHRRQGDVRRAVRHFESVLALDVDFPNTRARLEALRARLGGTEPGAPATDETIAGAGTPAGAARYRLLRELGRGATGAVYLARDVELDREVAVKLLHPHLYAEAQAGARARFFGEARVAASLRHPNIIAILDLDEQKKRIVMELGGGGTLHARLSRGPLPPGVALARHVEVLSALAAAHRRGVVHRDLKPLNLLFRRDPDAPGSEIVLCDFGVAHLSAADRRRESRESEKELLGTLAYMAPEQRRVEEVDGRADLYAAAVILWETLVGRLPWSKEVTLRGTRRERDLALPEETARALGALASPLERHLLTIGHPDVAARPATAEALEAARALADTPSEQEIAAFRRDLADLFEADS